MQFNTKNRIEIEDLRGKTKRNKILFSAFLQLVFCFFSFSQDIYKWLELRYYLEPPSAVPSYYYEVSNLVKEITPLAKALKNEHALNFLRKHSLRQVVGISYFKTLYPDISDSALALAALLTGLQENYLDKNEQAGAAKLSVFQGLECGFRIDSYIDERFNLRESLLCLQHWMRQLRWDFEFQLQQSGFDNPLANWKQAFNLLLLYFQTIVPAQKFQPNLSYTDLRHDFDVSLGQWMVSRNDIRLTQSLNPALRSEIVPKNYLVKIPSNISEFNDPKPWTVQKNDTASEQERSQRKTYYTVRKGDTLTSIARRFGTSVQAIKAENHLKSDLIAPGQRIVIPVEK